MYIILQFFNKLKKLEVNGYKSNSSESASEDSVQLGDESYR